MTSVSAGVVDVYVLRRVRDDWQVLVLQRGPGTRCTNSWETVHGRVETGERPEDAARREVREETGLEIERLYSITVQPFYLHKLTTIMLGVVFAAVVEGSSSVALGPEHKASEWLSVPDATGRYNWPRSRVALEEIAFLLRTGDAGVVEDVLRVDM
ncbi:MAG: NUDIX domain-containing protein [Anaerolineae bacterium]|nr:NUDIX domain-containing protein [Gemmatimonadaceae bacterium]